VGVEKSAYETATNLLTLFGLTIGPHGAATDETYDPDLISALVFTDSPPSRLPVAEAAWRNLSTVIKLLSCEQWMVPK
jgi:hypothetical protein